MTRAEAVVRVARATGGDPVAALVEAGIVSEAEVARYVTRRAIAAVPLEPAA